MAIQRRAALLRWSRGRRDAMVWRNARPLRHELGRRRTMTALDMKLELVTARCAEVAERATVWHLCDVQHHVARQVALTNEGMTTLVTDERTDLKVRTQVQHELTALGSLERAVVELTEQYIALSNQIRRLLLLIFLKNLTI